MLENGISKIKLNKLDGSVVPTNDNFYKQLIEQSTIGYAYHKIICDKDGRPCDYEFIEVNAAFEKFTGLKGVDIVGKKITKVIPDIKKDKFDWINFYGDIAINSGKKELEMFSEYFNCWYRIEIFSYEKYYFITQFVDITREKTELSGIVKLVEISEEFLQIQEQKIDYQKIVDDFLQICGAKYAVFNMFDEESENFITMGVSANNTILKKISHIMGFNIEKKKWQYSSLIDKKIEDNVITHFNSLSKLVEEVIPLPLLVLSEKVANIGEVVLIKILSKNVMLGHFVLFMEKGKLFDKDVLAEVYTRQLGMLITRKRAEDELSQQKILTDAIFDSSPGMIYLYNDKSRLVRWNKKLVDMTGYCPEELSKMMLSDLYSPEDKKSHKTIRAAVRRTIEQGFCDGEAEMVKKDGTIVPMHFTASALYLDGERYFAGVAIDISERKKREMEIFRLSYYDQLTGLYNRRFYEEELNKLDIEKNLPMTIVMGDVNGLKLMNDSFGHVMGDELLKKVAGAIKAGCRADDIVARLSGDEFIIILRKTDAIETEKIIKRINNLLYSEKVGNLNVSISFGQETKNKKQEKIDEIFKKAEDKMYKTKLFEGPNIRGKAIGTMINNINGKSKREGEHSKRVSALCKTVGEALGMNKYEVSGLKSAGFLHDIGKIALDGDILNKQGQLTENEWIEIKQHPEIGYRILNAVNGLSGIANSVLYHHERWDGKGYPKKD